MIKFSVRDLIWLTIVCGCLFLTVTNSIAYQQKIKKLKNSIYELQNDIGILKKQRNWRSQWTKQPASKDSRATD